MPELVNPLAAFRDGYNTLEGMAQDRARRQAGNALAGGDYQGAQSALYGRGMLQEGQAVQQQQLGMQDRQAGQQAAMDEAKKKQLAQTFTLLGNVNEAMAQIPAEQRADYFRTQVVPQLQGLPGVTPEAIQQMMDPSYDWTDQGIATHRALLGQEAEKLQLFNTAGGIVGVQGGQSRMIYEAPQDPTRGVPPGYRWNADKTGMEYIPGGPADPRVVGTRAAAGRAPQRPRASSGGGSRGHGFSDVPPGAVVE